MDLSADRLASQVAKEPLRPAYLIAGNEPLLVLEAADAVRAAARAQGIGEREVHDMEGRDADWGALDAAIHAPSLFASQRLVEVRLPTGKPGTEGAKLITGICADPPPDVVLLVIAGEWSKQHGGKWAEAIGKVGHVAIAWPVKPHDLVGWVAQRMRSRGVQASQDAIARLAQRVEGNLLAAAQEIDKLALLTRGEPGMLDLERMDALVADSLHRCHEVIEEKTVTIRQQEGQVFFRHDAALLGYLVDGFIYTVWRYMAYGSRADLAYTVNAEGTLELSASIAELEDILLPRQSRDASLFIPSRSRSSATDIADALEKHINIKMLRMLVALGKGQLQLIPDDAKGMRLSLTLPKW